ncbi:MAG TPA: hypothetical protein VFA47_11405 [Candidatus Manganitrophaceae bacterium]|nr:hypothetical protein [Candidatus Manganitrophaceae bacterium]
MKMRFVIFLLVLGFLPMAAPAVAESQRRVVGRVEAVEPGAVPQTIVIKTTLPGGKTWIVGCRLDQKTKIQIGKQTATLEEIRPGDLVQLIYRRVEDGLVAEKIEKKTDIQVGKRQ